MMPEEVPRWFPPSLLQQVLAVRLGPDPLMITADPPGVLAGKQGDL
jgi:hypothetical protein